MNYFVRIDYRIGNSPILRKRFLCFDFDELTIEVKSLLSMDGSIMSIKFERTV